MSASGGRLDVDRIVALRTAAGLSQRELGRRLGFNPATMPRLERHGGSFLTLEMASRLAAALGVRLFDLLADSSVAASDGLDGAVVEAALLSVRQPISNTRLSWALGWDIDRTSRALAALDGRLARTGSTVVSSSDGLRVTAATLLLSPAVQERLMVAGADARLTASHLKVLHDLWLGNSVRAAAAKSVAAWMTQRTLIGLGLCELTKNRLVLTAVGTAALASPPHANRRAQAQPVAAPRRRSMASNSRSR